MALESTIQASIIMTLEEQFPGAVVLKTDPSYIQGFPDLLFLQNNFWAALEVKRAEHSSRQPNQEFWVDTLDVLSFSRFIYPANVCRVLDELDAAARRNMVRR